MWFFLFAFLTGAKRRCDHKCYEGSLEIIALPITNYLVNKATCIRCGLFVFGCMVFFRSKANTNFFHGSCTHQNVCVVREGCGHCHTVVATSAHPRNITEHAAVLRPVHVQEFLLNPFLNLISVPAISTTVGYKKMNVRTHVTVTNEPTTI